MRRFVWLFLTCSLILLPLVAQAATSITTRAGAGRSLTWTEFDNNFLNLRNAIDSGIGANAAAIAALQAGQGSGTVAFSTVASMTLNYPDGTSAIVTNDPTGSNNTYWRKSGSSGSGSWTKSAWPSALPFVDARNYADFSSAVAAQGSTPTTLLISTAMSVATDITTPSTLRLQFVAGGQLSISSGKTVTINGPIVAGLHQIVSGAGAIVIADNAVEYVHPVWWGSGNDATAKAVAAHKHTRLSAGTYTIASTLLLPTDRTLSGIGPQSILTVVNAFGDIPVIRNATLSASTGSRDSNITIRDLQIDGNAANNGAATEFEHGISLRGVAGALIQNVKIINTTGDGVYVGYGAEHNIGSERVAIINNTIVDYRRNGIGITDVNDALVSGNSIIITAHTTELHGIDIEENGPSSVVKNVRIIDNVIDGGGGGTIYAGVAAGNAGTAENFSDILISGNIIKNRTGNGISFRGITNLLIRGNVIESVTRSGIEEMSGGVSASHIKITDNIIKSVGANGISKSVTNAHVSINNNQITGGSIGILVDTLDGASISGNTSYGASVAGILLGAAVTNSTISNNTVRNTVNGLYATGAATKNTLAGNVISNNSNCGIALVASTADNILTGNSMYSNAGGNTSDSGTGNGLPVYANNSAAISGGLSRGQQYRTSAGAVLMVY